MPGTPVLWRVQRQHRRESTVYRKEVMIKDLQLKRKQTWYVLRTVQNVRFVYGAGWNTGRVLLYLLQVTEDVILEPLFIGLPSKER